MLATGTLIGGRYRVLGPLGAGGMGAIYKARIEATGELVALKVILAAHMRDPELLLRFRREASAAEAIRHPNVTALRDRGEHEGQPFLVFEHVPGGSIDRVLREKGPLPWREASARGAEVARGLAALHEHGFVHRDLKPENVLVDDKGHAKLADFGLVGRAAGAGPGSITETGQIVGTCSYMAPEQADGREVDARADLYGLGALIFALLTGRPPFEGHGVEALIKLLHEAPPSPRRYAPATPARLDRLVLALLARDPARRPRSARDVASELEKLEPTTRRGRVVPVLAGVVASGALMALAVGARERAVPRRGAPDVEPVRAPPGAREAPGAPAALSARELTQRAHHKLDAHDFSGAIEDLTRAVALEPALAEAFALRGMARLAQGHLEEALADETRAIELAPGNSRTWSLRAEIRGTGGDFEGAIGDMTRAIELDPRVARFWSVRGWARLRRGDSEGALEDASGAIALEPNRAEAWELRAATRHRRGEPREVVADATRAIELAPTRAEVWFYRGASHLSLHELDAATRDLTRAIELAPDHGLAWYSLGCVRELRADHDGAIAAETKAIELAPRLGAAWQVRGTAWLSKEVPENAVPDLERALELEPDGVNSPAVRGLLEQARSMRSR